MVGLQGNMIIVIDVLPEDFGPLFRYFLLNLWYTFFVGTYYNHIFKKKVIQDKNNYPLCGCILVCCLGILILIKKKNSSNQINANA